MRGVVTTSGSREVGTLRSHEVATRSWLIGLQAGEMAHGFSLVLELAAEGELDPRGTAERIIRLFVASGLIVRGEPRWSGRFEQMGDLVCNSWPKVLKRLTRDGYREGDELHYVWMICR